MPTQAEKAATFHSLHYRKEPLIVANPWDAGTARILTALGGLAVTLGRRDGTASITRDEALANAKAIADATHLPVAADLENGYGHSPEDAAETIRLAAEAGLVGGSIEDATGDPAHPIYGFNQTVERVAAAAEAAHALPFPFMFVARAENYLHGKPDLDDTIRRLQAFEQAGAEVLYAPGLTHAEDIQAVCAAVSKPVNVLAALKGAPHLSVAELAALGVRRISLGSALSRAALSAFIHASREIQEKGTFTFAAETYSLSEVIDLAVN
jgi:2-methylisocitrate lyase-like PEP mutase family enzyme